MTLSTLRGTRTVTSRLGGPVAAGTVLVPDRIELTADTTIVGRHIRVAAGTVRVTSNGYALHVFAEDSLRVAGSPITTSTVTIDTSGPSGTAGGTGGQGRSGFPGSDGQSGMSAWDQYMCDGWPGGGGSSGQSGDSGGDGHPGGSGGDAGPITLDIPPGSTDGYQLIARGGGGGPRWPRR